MITTKETTKMGFFEPHQPTQITEEELVALTKLGEIYKYAAKVMVNLGIWQVINE